MLLKVENSGFVRDTNSMALLNVNNSEKNDYLSKARLLKTQKEQINTVKAEIDEVKSDVAEIKMLLRKLLEGANG
jgi:hypothetical protein